MTTYFRGTTASLTVQWYEFAGGPPVDVNAQTVTITRISDATVVVGPTAVGITHLATGLYSYPWVISPVESPGDYVVVWNAIDAALDPVQTSEIVTVASAVAPCSWPIDPSQCCDDWASYSDDLKERAIRYATLVLWAATGRRFNQCPVTVRPCGRYTRGGMPSIWGYTVSLYSGQGGAWYPYIDADGAWRNCACPVTACGCYPDCEVFLPGPVASVTEVIQDGLVVPANAYRVDDGRWLVRTDGQCWPDRADYNVNSGVGFFQVTYVRGDPIPQALSDAAGTLACEFAKGCATGNCRLPGNVVSLARQGVTVNMMDLAQLLDRNLTGIPEVDQVIVSLNPYGLKARLRVWSPEIKVPRMTTWVSP